MLPASALAEQESDGPFGRRRGRRSCRARESIRDRTSRCPGGGNRQGSRLQGAKAVSTPSLIPGGPWPWSLPVEDRPAGCASRPHGPVRTALLGRRGRPQQGRQGQPRRHEGPLQREGRGRVGGAQPLQRRHGCTPAGQGMSAGHGPRGGPNARQRTGLTRRFQRGRRPFVRSSFWGTWCSSGAAGRCGTRSYPAPSMSGGNCTTP